MGELKPYLVVLVTSYISGLQTLPVLNNDYLTDSNLTGYPLHNPVLYLDEIVFPARQSTAKEKSVGPHFVLDTRLMTCSFTDIVVVHCCTVLMVAPATKLV